MKPESLIAERDLLRSRWRGVREDRLLLKKNLQDDNLKTADIRKNREYRRLKKEQRHISNMIKHAEYKIIRAAVNGER